MPTLAEPLTALVSAAANAAFGDTGVAVDPCVPTSNAKNGDYQSNFAFKLSKAVAGGGKPNPRATAEKLLAAIPETSILARRPEIAGPGFINFTLSEAFISADLQARAADPKLGTPQTGRGRRMVIDYSSPNIAKRMHVGHLRSTIIGAAIDRLHRFLGWEVIADNHIGDWGTQFGKLIVGWHLWRDDVAYAADPIAELQRIYVKFGEAAKADPALSDRARAETAKLQAGDPENRALWQTFCEQSMVEFDGVYKRLGVTFDIVHGESFYEPMLADLVAMLIDKGLAVESDGALIFPLDAPLTENPLLLRKRDGAALYGTTDLATVKHRLEVLKVDRSVYVVGMPQKLHFNQVFSAARKIGWDGDFVHVGFGLLRLPEGNVLSTRQGSDSMNLTDVLDTAVEYARKVVDEKSGHLSEAERAHIAEAVGTGAIRYADLSQNPTTDIVFEWSKMLSLDGNTAPYLMYAVARCHSIFKKAEVPFGPGPIDVKEPTERELALQISKLPEVIESAASSYRPNLLAEQLFIIANAFARFYGECRVIDAEPDVRAARLGLVHATARAMTVGMQVLGLTVLERM